MYNNMKKDLSGILMLRSDLLYIEELEGDKIESISM